jgi:hypothetical protein
MVDNLVKKVTKEITEITFFCNYEGNSDRDRDSDSF